MGLSMFDSTVASLDEVSVSGSLGMGSDRWSGGVVGVEAALVVLLVIGAEISSTGAGGVGEVSAAAAVVSSSNVGAADRGRKLKLGTNSIAFMLSVENVPPRSLLSSCAMVSGSSGLRERYKN